MTPRKYELRQRAEAAAATRQRIVEATMQVHGRRGISAATVREIADEADVSPGTVLKHFPRMEELVLACGTHTAHLMPFPGPEILDGIDDPRERLRAAVAASFRVWDVAPRMWQVVEYERLNWAPVEEVTGGYEVAHRALLDVALPPGRSKKRARLLAVAVASTTWKSRAELRAAGLDVEQAATAVVDVILPAGA